MNKFLVEKLMCFLIESFSWEDLLFEEEERLFRLT
jgi:hypothetical protein